MGSYGKPGFPYRETRYGVVIESALILTHISMLTLSINFCVNSGAFGKIDHRFDIRKSISKVYQKQGGWGRRGMQSSSNLGFPTFRCLILTLKLGPKSIISRY